MQKNVFILSAQRTPIGSMMGTLSNFTATQLGSFAAKAAIKNANINPDQINEVIFGQVLTAGAGQAPARQTSLGAGIPNSVPCLTINKVCGSGLKAVMLGCDSIQLGNSNVVLAGGQECMSKAPHLLEGSRSGYRMGSTSMTDSMIKDGLWDPYNNWHMGNAGELCVKEYNFTREQQDQFAIESYKKAQAAQLGGLFKNEITGVEITDKKGTTIISEDEEPNNTKFDKIPTLRPAFDKAGTITAANASKINDGAAAILLASEEFTKKNNSKPLARVVGYATFAQDPKWFTTAPVGAIKDVLKKTSLSASQIDLWEINEAFSNVTMAAMKDIEIPSEKVNVNGGAVALGHPIGASGARILTTLTYALQNRQKKYGLATLCIGGGEAVAMIIERV